MNRPEIRKTLSPILERLYQRQPGCIKLQPGWFLLSCVARTLPSAIYKIEGNYSALFSGRKLLVLVQIFAFMIREIDYAHTRQIPKIFMTSRQTPFSR